MDAPRTLGHRLEQRRGTLRAALRSVHGALSWVDVAALRLLQDLVDPESYRIGDVTKRLAELEAAEAVYGALDPETFYRAPPKLRHVRADLVRRLGRRGEVIDLTWPSGHVPHATARLEKYRHLTKNDTVHARWFRHERAVATIICVHGYRGGAYALEELLWPVSKLYGLGLDVVLFTLPFHGRRSPRELPGPVLFPSNRDLFLTVEGFGQAIWDLRSLFAWLGGQGSRSIGVAGMSLGGYVAALLATIERRLELVVPYIPLADFAQAFSAHLELRGRRVPQELLDAGQRAMRLCRPLLRTPLVEPERVLVIGAEHDRITGRSHAEQLARHFQAELVLFPGAHMLHVGRRQAFAAMCGLFERLGLVDRGRVH
ncbi:alpha/beta hydrolase family protein [Myxococcota bacterium]|nr:alpha/beta hydrolase family protein [Myxococcota bacterium]